jgi:hypothetical protein
VSVFLDGHYLKMSQHIKKLMHNIERHIVLMGPQVPWNTGNIGRTCLGTGAFLHLIKPLGFSLENRELKRAGLDYWHNVKLSVWDVRTGFFSFSDRKPRDFRKRYYPNINTPPISSPLHQIFGV